MVYTRLGAAGRHGRVQIGRHVVARDARADTSRSNTRARENPKFFYIDRLRFLALVMLLRQGRC